MKKIRKKIARITRKIEKLKNWKTLIIYLLLISVSIASMLIIFLTIIELFAGTLAFISSNKDFAEILTTGSSGKLALWYLLNNNFSIIQIIIIYISFLFCSLWGWNDVFRVDDDIKKLPEVVIPKAKKLINEYPKANPILAPLIQEAESKDDGEELLKMLKEFQRLRCLENEPEYLIKTTEDEIKKIKEEEVQLKKKLGLN